MEIITYSLRDEQGRSDGFYRDIAAFTDEVLREIDARAGPLLDGFHAFVRATGREVERTRSEYALELLVLSVLARVYGPCAPGVSPAARGVLVGLARLRRRAKVLRPGLDTLQGALVNALLPLDARQGSDCALTLDTFDALLGWLSAAGKFEQEVGRLRGWRQFWAGRPAAASRDELCAVAGLGEWFEAASLAALGRYTPNVEHVLAEIYPSYRGREDQVLCGRRRVEYHLNMVGVEILNRAFRPAFLATSRKFVLAPPCMRAQPEDLCRATASELGAVCGACTPGCRIHQLTKLGEKHGFGVRMLPDELRVFSGGSAHGFDGAGVGIVGIACALTDVSGGWELRALGVPAQGLLLDYCGCPWHWHPDGIRTDTNFRELLRLVGASQGDA